MKNNKRYFSLMMIIVLTICLNTFSTYSEPSEWAVGSIEALLENNFISNEHIDTNKIKSNITREEFADLVVKLYSSKTKILMEDIKMEDPFEDTDNEMVQKAYSLGIVKGISDKLFAPSKEITRQEIATMLLSAMNLMEIDTTIYEKATFDDMDKVAVWAKDGVDFSSQEGILRGVGNNLIDPLNFTTWEQAIVLVHRIMQKYDFEDAYGYEDLVEVIAEVSMDNYEVLENGHIIPKNTELLIDKNEEAGLHLRLTANGSEGNRDLNEKINELFEVLSINQIPEEVINSFRQTIEDTWTVFNAPQTSEPIIVTLDDGKRIELNCDLNVRISIYTPFLYINNGEISMDSFTRLSTGYLVPKDSDLVIRTNLQMGNKLEITIFETEETDKIINKLNELFLILRVNDIPLTTIEKIERDISSSWNYTIGKPGKVYPELEDIHNGDQLVYSSGGFVQIKIFSY